MTNPAMALRSVLMTHLTGQPEDDSGRHEANDQVGYLVELVEGMGMGDYSPEEVALAFQKHGPKGFDFPLWYYEQQEAGVYAA